MVNSSMFKMRGLQTPTSELAVAGRSSINEAQPATHTQKPTATEAKECIKRLHRKVGKHIRIKLEKTANHKACPSYYLLDIVITILSPLIHNCVTICVRLLLHSPVYCAQSLLSYLLHIVSISSIILTSLLPCVYMPKFLRVFVSFLLGFLGPKYCVS